MKKSILVVNAKFTSCSETGRKNQIRDCVVRFFVNEYKRRRKFNDNE